jgi:murein DD-endopeptidase
MTAAQSGDLHSGRSVPVRWSLPLTVLLCAASLSAAAPNGPVADQGFDAIIPYRPTPVAIGGTQRLLYELHLTSFARVPLVPLRLEVINPESGDVLLDVTGVQLLALIEGASDKGISPGMRAVAYIDVAVPSGGMPKHLAHRLSYSRDDGDARHDVTIAAGSVAIDAQPPPLLGPPLKGGPWVAVYAPEMANGHRRYVYAIDGKARIPGRFAVDFMKVDSAGRLAPTDNAAAAAHFGFGAEVLAVADRLPGEGSPAALADATGNYVALDLGGGRYAFYGHLSPGLRVKPGQRVRRGQVIARLGFTGQASAPHLHFHVSDAPSPLIAEGRPWLIDRYEMLGGYPSIEAFGRGGAWVSDTRQPGPSLPPPNAVIRFPG